MSQIVTVVVTVQMLKRGSAEAEAEALDRLRSRLLATIDEEGAEVIPCDWAPDADTIGDCVDNPDGADLPVHVEVLDLNPPRNDSDCVNCGIDLAAHDDNELAACKREHTDALGGRA